jgi:O-methyltransferase involved in polyketide biosynthesis
MKQGRVSQTALKVAHNLVALSAKDDWAERLPAGLAEMSERLLLASGSPGFGPRMMRISKGPWMVRAYKLQDLLMPKQFEGFGYRKIFMQEQVEAAIEHGARQVLFTGAGFDTLCLRLAPQHPNVQFIELDHPATSAAKAKGIALEGQPTNMFQIAADLGERSLSLTRLVAEPWKSAVKSEDLPEYVEGTGWKIISDVDTDEAHGVERYAVAERR